MGRRFLPPARPVTLRLDGASLVANEGEPLAAALVAAGVDTIARSPKFHRPRGASCMRGGCDGCVVRVDGPQPVRYHARLGELLPLDRGAAGRVLLAYAGKPGNPYEAVRRDGCCATFGERDPAVGSVAAPVFGENRMLVGAVAVTGPLERFDAAAAKRYVRPLQLAASRLTSELGGRLVTVKRAG